MLLLPRDVRRAHGAEMTQVFSLLEARARERGRIAHVAFCVRAYAELLASGIGERLLRRREDGRTGHMLDDLWMDLKLAGRNMVRTPAQAAVLILTLALGTGATTAIFSVLHGVLFTPLPYEDPEELVAIRHRLNVEGVGLRGPGGPDLLDYMDGAPSVEAFGGVQTIETNLNDDQGAARVTVGWTTPGFFQMLGTEAALGRMLLPSDWAGAARAQMEDPSFTPPPMAVVLDYGLWRSRFASDPGVLGRSIRVNGQSMNVVGVLPEGFRLHMPADAELAPRVDAFALMPVPLSDGARGASGMQTIARLGDGISLEQATGELEAVAAGFRELHERHTRLNTHVVVDLLHDEVVGPAKSFLWLLFGAVGLLLLIACTNVANLLLVRASARETEFAVRSALGVGRLRLFRQLLTEGLLLAVLGTGAGLFLASWSVRVLVALRPANLPRLEAVSLDGTVLLFGVALSVAVALLFGLAPTVASGRTNPRTLVSGRGSGEGTRASTRLRGLLIMGELAVSVVLVAGAGLLLRSFAELSRVDLGFEAEDVVAVDAALPFFSYRESDKRAQFFVRLAEMAAELPGVTSAGAIGALPLETGAGSWSAQYSTDGTPLDDESNPRARFRALSPGTLPTLGIRLTEGRDFSFADEEPGGPVSVVVDRRIADARWPAGAVGQTLEIVVAAYTGQPWTTEARVVGVAEPARFTSVAEADEPTIYVPYRVYATIDGTIVLKTKNDPTEVAAGVRQLVTQLDASVPVFAVRRLSTVVSQATAESQYALVLIGIFALTALILAAVGLYGVISTLVQQRTREIGIRIAHGALGADIGRMVVRDGARLVAPGLVLGLGAAALMGPVVRSLLFRTEPVDPPTLITTAIILGGVALLASTLPALRAARVDPVQALREN